MRVFSLRSKRFGSDPLSRHLSFPLAVEFCWKHRISHLKTTWSLWYCGLLIYYGCQWQNLDQKVSVESSFSFTSIILFLDFGWCRESTWYLLLWFIWTEGLGKMSRWVYIYEIIPGECCSETLPMPEMHHRGWLPKPPWSVWVRLSSAQLIPL